MLASTDGRARDGRPGGRPRTRGSAPPSATVAKYTFTLGLARIVAYPFFIVLLNHHSTAPTRAGSKNFLCGPSKLSISNTDEPLRGGDGTRYGESPSANMRSPLPHLALPRRGGSTHSG